MASNILNEMEFCKQQIKRYNEMYENLLTKYSLMVLSDLTPSPAPSNKRSNRKQMSTKSRSKRSSSSESSSLESSESSEPGSCSSSSSESSENELANEIVNYISHADDRAAPLNPNKRTTTKPIFTKSVPSKSDDFDFDQLKDILASEADQNKKAIQQNAKADEIDFKRIEKKKYDARAGLKEHDDKLSKIYAEEARLLALGMDNETVRRRVREQFYPEAIPASERKTPKIYVKAPDGTGRMQNKSVSLLAFDEDYLEDDDPELTNEIVAKQEKGVENMERLDLPTISEEPNETNYKGNVIIDKISKLLDDDDDSGEDDEVIDEVVV